MHNIWCHALQDNKGTISTKELRHVLSSIGEKLSPKELDELTKEADPEGKGTVQFEVSSTVHKPACFVMHDCAFV